MCPYVDAFIDKITVILSMMHSTIYIHLSAFNVNADERREARLRRRRERSSECCAAESSEQREARLARRRVADRARHATRSTSQRERSLQQRREE